MSRHFWPVARDSARTRRP